MLNTEVSAFLDTIQHPFRDGIELIRDVILSVDAGLEEGIKWNGPNYTFQGLDRITLRIQPPKQQVQLILHRGAERKAQSEHRLIDSMVSFMEWKANDRAVLTFKSLAEIQMHATEIQEICRQWIQAGE